MLREHRSLDAGFRRRNIKRWSQGLDLLEMAVVIADETAEAIGMAHRRNAVEANDPKFESLVSLHARAMRVSREIICLIKGGFADGALGRWRTLHEIAVTAKFLSENDQETSERFLLHHDVQRYKMMMNYQEHHLAAKLEPFTDETLMASKEVSEKIVGQHGKAMKGQYGWASKVLCKDEVTFFDLEKAVGLEHWRPRYKWATQDTHSSYRHPMSLLGASESSRYTLLVGASNSGMTDPAQNLAYSLSVVTSALVEYAPNIDRLAVVEMLDILKAEIGETFLKIQRETLARSRNASVSRRLKRISFRLVRRFFARRSSREQPASF